jgi:hypothetical protein
MIPIKDFFFCIFQSMIKCNLYISFYEICMKNLEFDRMHTK